MAVTLTVAHNLFLSREERYSLYDGKELTVVGVSVPVWTNQGRSSEPAEEVFAKYQLAPGASLLINQAEEGYKITFPKVPSRPFKPLPDDLWNSLPPDAQDRWYEHHEPQPSLVNLLDVKDGGSNYLLFRQYSKVRRNNKVLHILHFLEIKPIEDLMASMV